MERVVHRLKAVIAEDEPVLRGELRDALAKLWPDLEICAEADDGIAALREISAHASGKCHIAFVTAYDQYAVAAFEQGAIDYVMKPFSAARLATTIERLKAKAASLPASLDGLIRTLAEAAGTRKEYLRWITASQGNELRLITVDEIVYFQADNKYTLVVTPEKESLIRRPIKELIDELDPQTFWQIHRGTLVNVNAIAGVHRDIGGHMRVKLRGRKETLPVSEPYYGLFKQM